MRLRCFSLHRSRNLDWSHYCRPLTPISAPSDPNAQSRGPGNIAIIGSPREVARVALKILLTVAMALILSPESTAAILPQGPAIRNRGRALPVLKYYQQYATQDGNPVPITWSSLLAPATELRLSASLANSYRNRDQGSRHTAPSGCAVVSRCGRSGRLDCARHRCDGPPSERLQ